MTRFIAARVLVLVLAEAFVLVDWLLESEELPVRRVIGSEFVANPTWWHPGQARRTTVWKVFPLTVRCTYTGQIVVGIALRRFHKQLNS